jgi:hypothetical protein
MAGVKKPQGDRSGKDAVKRCLALLEKLAKDHPNTPWEVLAKREALANLGLEWQSTKVGRQ